MYAIRLGPVHYSTGSGTLTIRLGRVHYLPKFILQRRDIHANFDENIS